MLTLDDVDVKGRRVLLRSDLNVPLSNGEVADDFRVQATLPTIDRLRRSGATVVVCSHLGRPDGRLVDKLRMAPVAVTLSELGGFPVVAARDTVGPDAHRLVERAGPGEVILLENTRFHPGETADDQDYAAALAELGDLFVLDAFGSAHRAHASTSGVAILLKSVAGPLLLSELRAFGNLLEDPPRPFTVVLGGAKVSDKLPLLQALAPKVDAVLVGGGMCFSLLAAEGYEVGKSLLDDDCLDSLTELLRGETGDRIVLPLDVVVAERFSPDATPRQVDAARMEDGFLGLDIGSRTTELFADVIAGSGSVFWNGPMGVFEWEAFRAGTEAVAVAVAESDAFTVVGGGDSVAALRLLGREADPSHLSTGGGAGLELLQGLTLPALSALEKWSL